MNKTSKRVVKGVICVNTQERFTSMADACTRFNLDKAVVSKASNGKRKTAGKYKGEPLRWMLIEDWDKLPEDEQQKLIQECKINIENIICLNSGVTFKDIDEASRCYDIPHSQIYKSCIENKNISDENITYGGKYRKKRLIWMKIKDYNKLSEFEIAKFKIMSKEHKQSGTKVVCLNTGEVFPSIDVASVYYNISATDLTNSCYGRRNHAGEKKGELLKWMQFEKYQKLTEKEIQDILETDNIRKFPVICLNTGKEYPSIRQATIKHNISRKSIESCCKGTALYAGNSNGENLVWAFPSDYKKFTKNKITKMIASAQK